MNTELIKQALERLVHLHLCEQEGLSSGQPTPEMWMEAVNQASEALQSAQSLQRPGGSDGWISVEDRLPEFGETVLVHYPSAGPGATAHLCGEDERKMLSKVWSGIFDAKNIWDHPEMFHPINDVTHWQPLPSPPKQQP
jgi:hypothetical protein